MNHTTYLLLGLILGFIIGLIAGFGYAKFIIDEALKRAWIEVTANGIKKLKSIKERGKNKWN